jgi:hypothetical protein
MVSKMVCNIIAPVIYLGALDAQFVSGRLRGDGKMVSWGAGRTRRQVFHSSRSPRAHLAIFARSSCADTPFLELALATLQHLPQPIRENQV